MSGADESLPSGVRVVASLARPNLPPKSLERLPLMVVKVIMLPCPEDSNGSRSGAGSRIVPDARRISSDDGCGSTGAA